MHVQKKDRATKWKQLYKRNSCYGKAAAAFDVLKTTLHRDLGLSREYSQLIEPFQTVFSWKD